MQQLQQPLERRGRRRARIGVAVVQPRLDRLEVPVAEVVERQVVELVHRVREVELVEEAPRPALRLRQPREDPALLERRRPLGRRGALATAVTISRAAFQSLFESFPPSSIAEYEKRTSCVSEFFSSP